MLCMCYQLCIAASNLEQTGKMNVVVFFADSSKISNNRSGLECLGMREVAAVQVNDIIKDSVLSADGSKNNFIGPKSRNVFLLLCLLKYRLSVHQLTKEMARDIRIRRSNYYDCEEFLKAALDSLVHFCQNALGMKTGKYHQKNLHITKN